MNDTPGSNFPEADSDLDQPKGESRTHDNANPMELLLVDSDFKHTAET